MKGPDDWVAVLERLAEWGIDFKATWLGDGTEEDRIRTRVAEAGLGDRVDLPGFVSDRDVVLTALREAHVFMFCHKTPESPRCLIEALVSGCPIVGYDSPFPADLISDHQGGRLVPLDDVEALAQAVADLSRDRTLLVDLIARAVSDGAPFSDVEVFRHRSELIKAHL